ncbi:MAG: ATP-binding protein, partial [Hyphomicrobiaceae bacterium]
HNDPERHGSSGWIGGIAAVLIVISACALIVVMNIKVNQEIDEFATTKTDSAQWSLAQLDVEHLALQNALTKALRSPDSFLDDVRRRYDVFYSRVNTLKTSEVYTALRETDNAAKELAKVEAFLSAAKPLIDDADPNLRKALPKLAAQAEELRPVVRKITLGGVTIFSREADAQRLGVVNLLALVSTITLTLIAALLFLLALLLWINRQSRQKTLEQSQMRSRFQAIVSTSLDAVIVANREGRVLDFNGVAEDIFGYSRAEAIGELLEDLIIPSRMVEAHRTGMDRYRRTGTSKVAGKGLLKLEARRKSGEVFPIEVSISSAQSVDGEVFVSFIRDISNRIAAENELIKARDDAVAGERTKANLLAIMSHEMRTPLNGMLGTLELFDMEEVTEKQRERLDIIRSSGQLLLQHVNNVLDISRADSGKIEPVAEEFSLTDLVSEVVDSQRAVAEHHGNLISQKVSTNGHDTCLGDVVLLRQILLNLIGNAVKFTRDGKITVTANRPENDTYIEFQINDTGIGIADEDKSRIFEDFVTLDTSYSRSAGGTGLGLGIARRLVEEIGGEIGVEGVPDKGSVFWFRVPLLEVSSVQKQLFSSPEKTSAIGAAPKLPSLRALIVEDNRINRFVARELLEQEGMKVDEAFDGAMGVRLAGENAYDIILMDISMPVLDGVEATRKIRATENSDEQVLIVALTAHALPADIERFRAAGMNDILVKPISRSSIRAILQDAAGNSKGHDNQKFDFPGSTAPQLTDEAQRSELSDTLGDDRVASLLDEFDIEMENALNQLADLSRSDVPRSELACLAHHAAGSAALLGARGLRSELIALEEFLLSPNEAIDEYDIDSLRLTWSKSRQLIRKGFQKNRSDQN